MIRFVFVLIALVAVWTLPTLAAMAVIPACIALVLWTSMEKEPAAGVRETAEAIERSRTVIGELEEPRIKHRAERKG